MPSVPAISSADVFRVRRWDVVMLGTALPGLVTAARLGQRGLRVLVLEETARTDAEELVREPFLLVGAEPSGVLGSCLRDLGVPLIEQRRFVPEEVAVQVCDSHARVDLGAATHTAEEWSSWGLAERQEARDFVEALDAAADAELQALLDTSLVTRTHQRAREALTPKRSGARRGWPDALDRAPDALRSLLSAPITALSNAGGAAPPPEARARLLGGLLRGGVSLQGGEGQLRALLRRRIQAVYGEFRRIDTPFRMVAVQQQPGLTVEGAKEIWSGRALVLNAPMAALADAAERETASLFRAPPVRWQRYALHFRGPAAQLPECMADRVVWRGGDGGPPVALRLFRSRRGPEPFDLIASVVDTARDEEAEKRAELRIEAALRDLLPFSEGALERVPVRVGDWDDDCLLADPADGGWPRAPQLRLSSRPLVYALDRAAVASLGSDGDLWLGWRAGDAIADDLD